MSIHHDDKILSFKLVTLIDVIPAGNSSLGFFAAQADIKSNKWTVGVTGVCLPCCLWWPVYAFDSWIYTVWLSSFIYTYIYIFQRLLTKNTFVFWTACNKFPSLGLLRNSLKFIMCCCKLCINKENILHTGKSSPCALSMKRKCSHIWMK